MCAIGSEQAMKCLYCQEEFEPGDKTRDIANGCLHEECLVRMTSGSVAHQNHECRCYGGAGEDLPGLTLRQAAKLAAENRKATLSRHLVN